MPIALLAAGIMLVLFAADALTPADFSVSALTIFPVLAVAWLCSARLVVAVTIWSVALHAALAIHGDLSFSRVSVHILEDVSVAILSRLAALSLAAVRDSREQELETLLQIGRGLSSAGELQEVLQEVARAGASFVSHGEGGRGRASVFRLRAGSAEVAAESDGESGRLSGRVFPISERMAEILGQDRAQVALVSEMAPAMREAFEGMGAGQVAMAPIHRGAEAIGWVSAASRVGAGFTSSETRLLEGIADLAGVAIETAERLDSERRRVRTFESLHEVATAVATAAEPSEVALLVADKALEIAGAGTAVLAWQARAGDVLRVLASRPEQVTVAYDPRRGALGKAFSTSQPVLLIGGKRFDDSDRAIAGQSGTILAVPLIVQGVALGALAIGSESSLSEDSVTSIELLAAQVAPLINQSRLQSGIDESKRGFRALYHALGCGVVVHDATGRLDDCNWAAENLLGVNRDQMAAGGVFGSGWELRLPNGADLPEPMRPPISVLSYGRPIQNLVVQVTAPGGAPHWLRIDCHAVDEQGSRKWVVTSFFEVAAPR